MYVCCSKGTSHMYDKNRYAKASVAEAQILPLVTWILFTGHSHQYILISIVPFTHIETGHTHTYTRYDTHTFYLEWMGVQSPVYAAKINEYLRHVLCTEFKREICPDYECILFAKMSIRFERVQVNRIAHKNWIDGDSKDTKNEQTNVRSTVIFKWLPSKLVFIKLIKYDASFELCEDFLLSYSFFRRNRTDQEDHSYLLRDKARINVQIVQVRIFVEDYLVRNINWQRSQSTNFPCSSIPFANIFEVFVYTLND